MGSPGNTKNYRSVHGPAIPDESFSYRCGIIRYGSRPFAGDGMYSFAFSTNVNSTHCRIRNKFCDARSAGATNNVATSASLQGPNSFRGMVSAIPIESCPPSPAQCADACCVWQSPVRERACHVVNHRQTASPAVSSAGGGTALQGHPLKFNPTHAPQLAPPKSYPTGRTLRPILRSHLSLSSPFSITFRLDCEVGLQQQNNVQIQSAGGERDSMRIYIRWGPPYNLDAHRYKYIGAVCVLVLVRVPDRAAQLCTARITRAAPELSRGAHRDAFRRPSRLFFVLSLRVPRCGVFLRFPRRRSCGSRVVLS